MEEPPQDPPLYNPHRDAELARGRAAQIEYGENMVARREQSAAFGMPVWLARFVRDRLPGTTVEDFATDRGSNVNRGRDAQHQEELDRYVADYLHRQTHGTPAQLPPAQYPPNPSVYVPASRWFSNLPRPDSPPPR